MVRGKKVDILYPEDITDIQRFHYIQLCEKYGRTEQELLSSSSRWIDDCMEVGDHIAVYEQEKVEKQKKEQEDKRILDNLRRRNNVKTRK